jgi:hypothetical protein
MHGVFTKQPICLTANQLEDLFKQQENNLNMLSLTEENCSSQVYQLSSDKEGSQQKVLPLNPRQLDVYKSTMLPTNMAAPRSQMAIQRSVKHNTKPQPW